MRPSYSCRRSAACSSSLKAPFSYLATQTRIRFRQIPCRLASLLRLSPPPGYFCATWRLNSTLYVLCRAIDSLPWPSQHGQSSDPDLSTPWGSLQVAGVVDDAVDGAELLRRHGDKLLDTCGIGDRAAHSDLPEPSRQGLSVLRGRHEGQTPPFAMQFTGDSGAGASCRRRRTRSTVGGSGPIWPAGSSRWR